MMLHLNPFSQKPPPTSGFGNNLFYGGVLFTLFGLAIFAAPELLAFLVATFFLIVGISLLSMWWKMKRVFKKGLFS